MKRKVINHDAVTIKDLETEIADLRVGIRNLVDTSAQFAQANHSLVEECKTLRKKLHLSRQETQRLTLEVSAQQEFQSRAHETIELLVKKMPYASETA